MNIRKFTTEALAEAFLADLRKKGFTGASAYRVGLVVKWDGCSY